MPKEPGRNLENMTFFVIKYDFLQYMIQLFKPMSFILDIYGYPPFPAFWVEDPLKTEANISELINMLGKKKDVFITEYTYCSTSKYLHGNQMQVRNKKNFLKRNFLSSPGKHKVHSKCCV